MPRFLKICSLDQWERDNDVSNCRRCNGPFGLTVRRHHCRACGKIYCNNCSNSHVPMVEENGSTLVQGQRCCMSCITRPSKDIEDALDAIEEQKQHAARNVPTLNQLKQQRNQQQQQQQQQPCGKSTTTGSAAVNNNAHEEVGQRQQTSIPVFSSSSIDASNQKNNSDPRDSTNTTSSSIANLTSNLADEATAVRVRTLSPPSSRSQQRDQQEQEQGQGHAANANRSFDDSPAPVERVSPEQCNNNNHLDNDESTSVQPAVPAVPVSSPLVVSPPLEARSAADAASPSRNNNGSKRVSIDPVAEATRRVCTRRVLDLVVAPGWTLLRTPAHQISMPHMLASEIELSSLVVPNTRTKAYKLSADIDASLIAATMLLSSMDMMAKCEPEVESRTVAAIAGGGAMRVSTRYKGTSVISGREFRTKSAFHELDESEVAALVTLGLNELPAAGFVSGSMNDDDDDENEVDGGNGDGNLHHPPPPDRHQAAANSSLNVIGEVHAFGIVVCAVKQFHPMRKSRQILRVNFICHTDPKGRIPAFALESPSIHDMMRRLNLFCTLVHSLDLTVGAGGDEDDDGRQHSDNNDSTFRTRFPGATPPSGKDDSLNVLGGLNNTVASSAESSVPPASPAGPSTSTSLCPSRRKVIAPLLRLFNGAHWVSENTKKDPGLFVCTSAVPRCRVKAHLVTCRIACSLYTFAEVVGDSALVSKYDPTIETFRAERTINCRVASVYSSYQRVSRFVDVRDFAVASAHVFLGVDDLQKEVSMEVLKRHHHFYAPRGDPSNHSEIVPPTSGFIQSAVDSHMIPPKDGYIRGVVHAYGFIATCEEQSHPEEITVSVISCVDPCGNIPNFLLDSAFSETISKLVGIKNICEEKQLTAPARSRSLSKLDSRTSSFASLHSGNNNNDDNNDNDGDTDESQQQRQQFNKNNINNSNNNMMFVVEGLPRANSAASSSGFISRGSDSDDDSLVTCDDIDGADELAKDDVLAAVVDLQRAQGWSNPSSMSNCRVESRLTSISDVRAVRTYREFRCTLETFREKLQDLDAMKKLDSSLEKIEFLLSPGHGQVIFTSHKSTSVFVSGREFCTLTCEKLLSTEEAANVGLCTPGMNSAVFVSSSVDAPSSFSKPDVAHGYVRGKVHAFGYVALATPPNAKRIRVYNIALVDPCGQIPAKVIQWAIGENAIKMDRFASICEVAQQVKNVANGEEQKQQQQQQQQDVVSSSHANENNNSNNSNDNHSNKQDDVNGVEPIEPLLHMMLHQTNMIWSAMQSPNASVCKVEKTGGGAGSGSPHIIRVKVEIKATLHTIETAFKSASYATVLQRLLEPQSISQDFCQINSGGGSGGGGSNASNTKVLKKIKLAAGFGHPKTGRATSVVFDTKLLDNEAGPKYHLFTEGFNGGAFVWSGQSPPLDRDSKECQENFVSFTELLGCVAVAVPVNAKRVRCSFWFAESLYAPGKKNAGAASTCSVDAGDAQSIATPFAQGVLKVAAYVENLQKEHDSNNSATTVTPSTDFSIFSFSQQQQQQQQQGQGQEQQTVQATPSKNDNKQHNSSFGATESGSSPASSSSPSSSSFTGNNFSASSPSQVANAVGAPPPPPPRSVPLGIAPEQERVLKLLLDLYKDRSGWSTPPKDAHGCTLQDMQVPFCDKKALRMELVMRCSIYTFVRFLSDKSLIPKYDPSMERLDEVSQSGRVKTIYTPYKQASRFITARDFAFDSTLAVVQSTDSVLPSSLQATLDANDEVVLTSSIHSTHVPEKQGFVRGVLHLYGYVAHADGPGKIRVTCLCCVDPSGRIPASLVDAAAAENCKKLVVIKNLCETMHGEKPLVDWYFDPNTGESTMAQHQAMLKKLEQQTSKVQSFQPSEELKEMGGPVMITQHEENIQEEQQEKQQQQQQLQQEEVEQKFNFDVQHQHAPKIVNRSISDGASAGQMKLLQRVINLFREDKWTFPPKEAHGCTLQDMQVPFCDKKAIRMELVMRCSLETFGAVLLNPSLTKRYDPTLVAMSQIGESSSSVGGKILSFHATYAQQSRFISARDFAFDSTIAILQAKDVFGSSAPQSSDEVLVSSAVHNATFPAQNGFVRGTLHVYGYVAFALPNVSDRIRVVCVACADPSGRIPAALVDAAAGESCKKLATIRDICEEIFKVDPVKSWNF